jgi:hypothetical protein
LCLFAILFYTILTVLILKRNIKVDLLKLLTIPLILFLAVFLVIVGYSQSQLTPVLGLLGTVVGYLLGKTSTDDVSSANK